MILIVDPDFIYKYLYVFENTLDSNNYLEHMYKGSDPSEFNTLFSDLLNIVKATAVVGNATCTLCIEEMIHYIEEHNYLRSYLPDTYARTKFAYAALGEFLTKTQPEDIEELMKKEEKLVGASTLYSIEDEPVHSWDEYFYNVAIQTARNSKCLSRRIGGVLVKDKSIISTGYNGPPRGVPHCGQRYTKDEDLVARLKKKNISSEDIDTKKCPRQVLGYKSGEGLDICIASHAEESCIVNCARMGINTMDSILYLTCGVPCVKCAVKIINAGIKEVVLTGLAQYDLTSKYVFDNSKVKLRTYDFIK